MSTMTTTTLITGDVEVGPDHLDAVVELDLQGDHVVTSITDPDQDIVIDPGLQDDQVAPHHHQKEERLVIHATILMMSLTNELGGDSSAR